MGAKARLAAASAAAALALAAAASAHDGVPLFGGSFASGNFVADSHSGGSGDWNFTVTFSGKGAGQITIQLYAIPAEPVNVDDSPDYDLCRPAVTVGSGTVSVKGSGNLTVTATDAVSCIRATSSGKKGTFTVTLINHP